MIIHNNRPQLYSNISYCWYTRSHPHPTFFSVLCSKGEHLPLRAPPQLKKGEHVLLLCHRCRRPCHLPPTPPGICMKILTCRDSRIQAETVQPIAAKFNPLIFVEIHALNGFYKTANELLAVWAAKTHFFIKHAYLRNRSTDCSQI